MSGLLLDTNIPSEMIRSQPDPRVSAWLHAQDEVTLYLSSITIGELRKGMITMPAGKRRTELEAWMSSDLIASFDDRIIPVTKSIADRWGTLSGHRKLAGRPVGMADGLIAATALEHGLTVVTRNVRDYEKLGLTLLNPWS
jgi:predicted nucleic acid-binding protein